MSGDHESELFIPVLGPVQVVSCSLCLRLSFWIQVHDQSHQRKVTRTVIKVCPESGRKESEEVATSDRRNVGLKV